MKKLIFTLLLFPFALISHAQWVTMMSYNVRNGNNIDNNFNLRRASSVIESQTPDIVALQELDSITVRSGYKDILLRYSELTSMHHTYATAIPYDGGSYGIGILSKEKPLAVKRIPLPGREESRVLLVTEFKKYIFCSTHLSLTPEDQMISLSIIDSVARTAKKPFFVAGDFNFAPQSEQYKTLQNTFDILTPTDGGTYPANEPVNCIDYIVFSKNGPFRIEDFSGRVVEAPTQSDHRPVIVDVKIGPKTQK